jgi:hypothetical protein
MMEQPQEEQPQEQQPQEEDIETLEEQTRIQLLTRGNYSCRIKPITSSKTTEKKNKPQYQQTIQLKNEISDSAEKISAMIKTIHQYANYFQPILESENIQLSKMTTEENLEKCEKITGEKIEQKPQTTKTPTKFVSLKTRHYSKTWQQQMLSIKKSSPTKTLIIFIDAVRHIIQILKHLQNKKIIHFNINPKTMLASEVRILPILTNFNLSFQIEDLKKEEEMENLFPNYEEYACWPIEVYIASRIANIREEQKQKPTKEQEHKLQKEEIQKWIDEFTKSPLFMKIASE